MLVVVMMLAYVDWLLLYGWGAVGGEGKKRDWTARVCDTPGIQSESSNPKEPHHAH